jgi:hypothetical protein
MKKIVVIVVFLTCTVFGYSQDAWTWTQLSDLPIPTANNALTEASISGQKFVYSFGGITSGLTHDSIHQRSFKYHVSSNQWTEVQSLPDTLGKIASAASFVKNKIYIIGGYHVDADGNEYSSNKVHVFNPFLDTFEVDAANIPIPIDDHVQAVWRDSLIFVVTGWSNTANVPYVQMYNPAFNSWVACTDVPNTNFFKSFGASGYILGDTLFYFGGVAGNFNFTARNYLRKGVINPEDPTDITWTFVGESPGLSSYRAAASGHNSTVFFVGGGAVAYNFDAIAYDGSGLVEPSPRILRYNKNTQTFIDNTNVPFGTMDHRGIAKLGGGNWIIAGGIDSAQVVSNRTFLLHNPALSNINKATIPPFFEVISQEGQFRVVTENVGEVSVFNSMGQRLYSSRKFLSDLYISKSSLSANFLVFVYDDGSNVPVSRKVILVN